MICTPMNVEDFLMMTEDEIDFDRLEIGVVAALAAQDAEPFIATSALGNLCGRDRAQTIVIASSILRRVDGDAYLGAFAMTILFGLAPEVCVDEMRRLLRGDPDPRMLEAMVDNVTADSSRFRGEQPLLSTLRRKVSAVPRDALSDPDEVSRFLAEDA